LFWDENWEILCTLKGLGLANWKKICTLFKISKLIRKNGGQSANSKSIQIIKKYAENSTYKNNKIIIM
jgi:hypothetical protein